MNLQTVSLKEWNEGEEKGIFQQMLEKAFKEWNEADHPRVPAGSSEGGQFTSSDGGSGEPSKLIPIEDLIAEAKKRMKKYENLWQAPEALVILVSPLRQTKEALEEMQYVASASSFDAMVRTVSSKMKWQLGWAAAADEWEAANHLGGNKQASKLTKEELSGPPQGYSRPRLAFTEEDKKAYRARQAWMQKKFRQEYGEEIELYRGVKGAYAKKLPESGEVDLPAYALSSWSANAYDAQQFMGKTPAARRSGRLLKTKVKVSDIWLLPRVGTEDVIRVADARDEVVVLNKDKTRRATVI